MGCSLRWVRCPPARPSSSPAHQPSKHADRRRQGHQQGGCGIETNRQHTPSSPCTGTSRERGLSIFDLPLPCRHLARRSAGVAPPSLHPTSRRPTLVSTHTRGSAPNLLPLELVCLAPTDASTTPDERQKLFKARAIHHPPTRPECRHPTRYLLASRSIPGGRPLATHYEDPTFALPLRLEGGRRPHARLARKGPAAGNQEGLPGDDRTAAAAVPPRPHQIRYVRRGTMQQARRVCSSYLGSGRRRPGILGKGCQERS